MRAKVAGDVNLEAGSDLAITAAVNRFDGKGANQALQAVSHDISSIIADGAITFIAGQDFNSEGSQLTAVGDVNISAQNNVAISAVADSYDYQYSKKSKKRTTEIKESSVTNQLATISGDNININAGEDLAINGGELTAKQDISLSAVGDTTIASVEDSEYSYFYQQKKKSLGRKKATTIETESTRNIASSLTAGNDIIINATQVNDILEGGVAAGYEANNQGRTVNIVGSVLNSDNNIVISATEDITATPGQDTDYAYYKKEKKGFGGLTGSSKSVTQKQVRQQQANITGTQDVTLAAGNNIALISPKISAQQGDLTLDAGNQILIGAAKDSDYEAITKSSNGAFKWSFESSGHYDETIRHAELTAGGDIKINAGNGIIIQYKQNGSLDESIATLSQLPELAWMAEVRKRDDVNWQALEEAHQQWLEKDSGIGGIGVTLIALAVAYAMPANVLGLTQTAVTGTTAAAIETAYITAIDSLISQAATNFIVTGGNVGTTLEQTLSANNLKSVLANVVFNAVGTKLEFKQNLNSLDFTQAVTQIAQAVTTKAVIDTAIVGGSFGENLRFAAIANLGQVAAEKIGQAAHVGDINTAAKYIAHAALGCTLGEASGGGCGAGVTGGIVGEAVGDAIVRKISSGEVNGTDLQYWQDKGVDLAKLAGGVAALALGQDISTVSNTAGNAAKNNALILIPLAIALLEITDAALTAKDAYNLAQAVEAGDSEKVAELTTSLGLALGTTSVPGNTVAIKIGQGIKRVFGNKADDVAKIGEEAGSIGAGAAKTSTKLISQFSTSTIDDAVAYAMKNKVTHVFGKAAHNLDPLVAKLGGQENTFRAVLNAANGKLPSSGVFNNIPVNVGGYNVMIRGSVVNGVPKIGTMFIP